MLIPLDYYRILGLPIQATAEQIQQSYRDRSRQLPRREYSEAAVEGRKQLIDEAYTVLADAESRARYDSLFLSKTYDETDLAEDPERLDSASSASEDLSELSASPQGDRNGMTPIAPPRISQSPSLEIETHQLVGALAILLELGEYDLVLKLGRPHLSQRPPDSSIAGETVFRSDIVLTVAVAYLEMGREQWQQRQYENAASSLEAGQALLLREGLFPQVRGEMQNDLQKLRPYRILELLALPLDEESLRQRGLELLREMLQERGGVDGTQDDGSGLNVDDFLRFIQQLRQYTTAAEQQLLFELEARRPSAVATYLAVYALIGRGFAQRQPGLIYRAKLLLVQLGRRQDVHLEQAVCALLLGQTEQASRALELSQEDEPIRLIQEHSQGSPDLLPGLCLYGERWLQEEVFPHFRDLNHLTASLKDYFADPRVQTHLENLPAENEDSAQWVVSATQTALPPPTDSMPVLAGANGLDYSPSQLSNHAGHSTSHSTSHWGRSPQSSALTGPTTGSTGRSSPSWDLSPSHNGGSLGRTSVSTPRFPGANPFTTPDTMTSSPSTSGPRRRRRRDSVSSTRSSTSVRRGGVKLDRLLVLIGGGLLALVLLWIVLSSLLSGLAALLGISGPQLSDNGADVSLSEPLFELPEPEPAPAPDAPLSREVAEATIERWLSVKSEAVGPDHNLDGLATALTGPALSEWQRRAENARRNGWYWQYDQHQVTVQSVELADETSDEAEVEATVQEVGTLYEGEQAINSTGSDPLTVVYQLLRVDGEWKIEDWSVR
ncbi:MAG: DnaJ-class molecular chaperone with C-terminal Zn finger domain [Phormidium sp. OSCR]|nr:MAG: DnaJ-class molecular chaperone with C-terminal Zn finger domain [Phormidium sp. OSCR]